MLLLHPNSLGNIIDAQRGKNKKNRTKNLYDLEQDAYIFYGFYCISSRFLHGKLHCFFLLCSVCVSNDLCLYNPRLQSLNIIIGSCLLGASVRNHQGK